MSREHHSKKQSFAPYAAIIIVAIVVIAIANAAIIYNNNQAAQIRDQQVISSISNTSAVNSQILHEIYKGDSKADMVLKQVVSMFTEGRLYEGQILFQLVNHTAPINNIGDKLDTLIAAHNEMIQAIENATGHHIFIHNTYIHNTNSYCTVINPKPSCHKK